jgi:hypothetical protein
MLAGEDRLSSTAMESFTQAPDNFDNCFTCHNTQAITANGTAFDKDTRGIKLLGPKRINVSHVVSQFVLEECFNAANQVANRDLPANSPLRSRTEDGSTSAVCPQQASP